MRFIKKDRALSYIALPFGLKFVRRRSYETIYRNYVWLTQNSTVKLPPPPPHATSIFGFVLKKEMDCLRSLYYAVKPEYIKVAEGELRKKQQRYVELILDVFSMLRKGGFSPFADSGTLLGAVRHKGFIPWDDDADIALMQNEVEPAYHYLSSCCHVLDTGGINHPDEFHRRLEEAFKEHPNEYILARCWHAFKVCKGTSLQDGVQLDIFSYSYWNEDVTADEVEQYRQHFRSQITPCTDWDTLLCLYQRELSTNPYYTHKSSRILWGIDNAVCFAGPHRFRGFISADDIFPLSELEFEGHMIPVPRNSQAVLSILYGNHWDVLPPYILFDLHEI